MDVSRLLRRVRAGERSALDELMPLVYDELRRIVQAFAFRHRPEQTLHPTVLVDEACTRLLDRTASDAADRVQLLALVSRVVRQVLVEHAREVGTGTGKLKLLDLHRALEALERQNASLVELIEMHYFGGMAVEEIAVAVGRSADVVAKELRFARAWVRRELAR